MSRGVERVLFWVPRILAVLFALFISLFALDVFGQGYSVWETIQALLIHLIPTGLIVASLIVAWRWEWLGAVLFPLLGVLYIVSMRAIEVTYLLIAGPLFLIGILFFLSWRLRPILVGARYH